MKCLKIKYLTNHTILHHQHQMMQFDTFYFFSLDDSSKKSLLSHLFSDLKGSSYMILSAVTAVFCFKGEFNSFE